MERRLLCGRKLTRKEASQQYFNKVSTIRLKTTVVIYGTLTVIAVGFGIVRGNSDIFNHPNGFLQCCLPIGIRQLIGFICGLCIGLLVVRFSRYSVYKFTWAQELHKEFRSIFGPLRSIEIFTFAAVSSAAEEIFFRGVMQIELGIIASSLIFGALHLATDKRLIVWSLQAAIMGFVLGGLYWFSGDLLAPVTAHFVINYQNLHFINNYDPVQKMPRSLVLSE